MKKYPVLIDWKTTLLECQCYPILIYRFSEIFIKILANSFAKIDRLILKVTWKFKVPRIIKIVLKNNEELTLSEFKIYYKAIVINIMWTSFRIEIYTSIKQNWGSRNKLIHLWSIDFWHGYQDNSLGGMVILTTGDGITGYTHAKRMKLQS